MIVQINPDKKGVDATIPPTNSRTAKAFSESTTLVIGPVGVVLKRARNCIRDRGFGIRRGVSLDDKKYRLDFYAHKAHPRLRRMCEQRVVGVVIDACQNTCC